MYLGEVFTVPEKEGGKYHVALQFKRTNKTGFHVATPLTLFFYY